MRRSHVLQRGVVGGECLRAAASPHSDSRGAGDEHDLTTSHVETETGRALRACFYDCPGIWHCTCSEILSLQRLCLLLFMYEGDFCLVAVCVGVTVNTLNHLWSADTGSDASLHLWDTKRAATSVRKYSKSERRWSFCTCGPGSDSKATIKHTYLGYFSYLSLY